MSAALDYLKPLCPANDIGNMRVGNVRITLSRFQPAFVKPVDANNVLIPQRRIAPKQERLPDDMSVQEYKLATTNPDDFDKLREQFAHLPDYLTRYFVDRYVAIFNQYKDNKNKARREANTYIRKRLTPAAERVRMVMTQYKNLPTSAKLKALSKRLDDLELEEANPTAEIISRNQQQSFNFSQTNVTRLNNKILAEMNADELKEMAFFISLSFQRRMGELADELAHLKTDDERDINAYEILAKYALDTFGIHAPRKRKNQTPLSSIQDISKLVSEDWWYRTLSKKRKIMREHLAIAMGQVSARASAYASWDCIFEHKEQKKKNWEFIKEAMLFDAESGEECELKDMVLKSQANPAIRRHELMVRTRGCENIGNELGLQGLFLTLTTPAKYHNSYKKGGFIDHWNGCTPKEAQSYLNKTWQRMRAKLNRDEIRFFGVRVAEPHHDGTPHWHLLIWLNPDDVDAFKRVFIDYATEEDTHELMTSGEFNYKARCDIKDIDPNKGSATGYIAKYISKNIDGFAMGDEVSDETGKSVKDMAKNVEAWKSRWNIRQFQFVGGAPVTTYRELRRFASQNKKAFVDYLHMQERIALIDMYEKAHADVVGVFKPARYMKDLEIIEVLAQQYQPHINSKHAQVAKVLKSADAGDWGGYLTEQGGVFVKRKELLVRNEYKVIEYGSAHGEDVKKIEGFTALGESWKTRLKEWSIMTKSDLEKLKERTQTKAEGFCSFVASGDSWSSVNNCTLAVNPRLVMQAVEKIMACDSYLDEMAFNALCRGASVNIGGSQYIKLRNPATSPEIMTYEDDRYRREKFLNDLEDFLC